MQTHTDILSMFKDLRISFDYHTEKINKKQTRKLDKKEHRIGRDRAKHQAELICWVLEKDWDIHKKDFL